MSTLAEQYIQGSDEQERIFDDAQAKINAMADKAEAAAVKSHEVEDENSDYPRMFYFYLMADDSVVFWVERDCHLEWMTREDLIENHGDVAEEFWPKEES